MPRHAQEQDVVDALAAKATLLLDNSSDKYDGIRDFDDSIADPDERRYDSIKRGREKAKATSPWQVGHIVWADLHGDGKPPVQVLVRSLRIEWSDHSCEYVNHVEGYPMRVDGKFSRRSRRVWRGDITRGYEKARALGLLPKDAVDADG